MVNGIGNGGGSLAKQAIQAALQRSHDASQRMSRAAGEATGSLGGAAPTSGSFAGKIAESVGDLAQVTKQVDELPHTLVTGGVNDIHEVTTKLKQAELSLKFALEVRNKFIDAYREVMRMSV